MDDKTLLQIAEEYGTPTYVFDADEAISRAEDIKSIMNDGMETGRIGLCYSIKANPFLIPALKDHVDNFEVCSPGELSICRHYNVPASMIIYSGVHKDTWDTAEALEYGCGILTAESVGQYRMICEKTEELRIRTEVILRLSADSQFGMSVRDAGEILEGFDGKGCVMICGIHYFAGTQRLKLKHQRDELLKLKDTIKGFRERYGIPLERLEYGPGLGYPYFEGDDFSDTLSPLQELAEDLRETSKWCSLTVEMGRFLASSCGYYLTKAVDKKTSGIKNWAILDGGINHINYYGQMMGLKVPVIKLLRQNEHKADDEVTEAWALCGSLCTTNDVLVREYRTGAFDIGDLFVFCNAGAYSVTEAMGLFLSRDLPGVVMAHRDEGTACIRNRMGTWELNC